MRHLIAALLGFVLYVPATQWATQTELFQFITAIHTLSPSSASAAGSAVIWPAVFLLACYGVASMTCQLLQGNFGGKTGTSVYATEVTGTIGTQRTFGALGKRPQTAK